MRLLEMFLQMWKDSNLETALIKIEQEIEARFHIFSDEDQFEVHFFLLDECGNMIRTDAYWECMELFTVLTELQVKKYPLMDLYVELTGWSDSMMVDQYEKSVTDKERQRLTHWLGEIRKISKKKRLLILQSKDDNWHLADGCSLEDYRDGSFSFTDMKVRNILFKYIMEPIRILVIARGKMGDICIEL